MALPLVELVTFNQYYSLGDWDGYLNVTFKGQPTYAGPPEVGLFYRIAYHVIATNEWVWQQDVPWEKGVSGVQIRFAHASPNGGQKTRIVDQVRISTHAVDESEEPVDFDIDTPSTLSPVHERIQMPSRIWYADLGDLNGRVDITWTDHSKFVSGGRIRLTKYGLTSPDIQQVLYDENFTGPSSQLAPGYVSITVPIIPPGIYLPAPVTWDPNNPPVSDPRSRLWCVERDTLSFELTTYIDGDAVGLVSHWTLVFNHTARFWQFAEVATKNQPYTHQLEIIQDPWVEIPITGTFTPKPEGTGGLPAGLSLDNDGLISGVPTELGNFYPEITLFGRSFTFQTEPVLIQVNVENIPVIQAPPNNVNLIFGQSYPSRYWLYATNNPTSYAIAVGTLPSGLSLNTANGQITGTPNTVETQVVNFTATNNVGTSEEYVVNFEVLLLAPPTITSANTLTVYQGEGCNYQITTNVPATWWRAFDLPAGLALSGSIITGQTNVALGEYQSSLQAANQWGWGPVSPLAVTVAIHHPDIYSPLTASVMVNEPFSYSIAATHNPLSYGAIGLPRNLMCNSVTGVISGIPVVIGTFSVTLTAVNQGGQGSAVLLLTVTAPPVPVIDTSVTNGRAITAEVGVPFIFQPAASHNPTHWSAAPIPDGLSFDISTGRLSGAFQTAGLMGVVFVASNAGGDSDPATFYFLVSESSSTAAQLNYLAVNTEIWININNAVVTIGSADNTAGTTFVTKRGDTVLPRVIFHDDGIPSDLIINALQFGAKLTLDSDYALFSDTFRKVGPGTYLIYPDFSQQNNILDELLQGVSPSSGSPTLPTSGTTTVTTTPSGVTTELTGPIPVPSKSSPGTLTLLGEIQWDENDPETGAAIRRSTPIFDVNILRDIVHPDPASIGAPT